MKYSKLLFGLILSLILINSISALIVESSFLDGTKSKTINYGESINFETIFGSMNPSMSLVIELRDSSESLIYTFLNLTTGSTDYTLVSSFNNTIYPSIGSYTIIAKGTDRLNSSQYDELTITVNAVPPVTDTTKPTIEILGPVNGTTYSSQVKFLNFIARDTNLNKCQYSTDNGVTRTDVSCLNGILTTVSINSTEGANKWIVYAQDVAGNIETKEVIFNVNSSLTDTTAPKITVISPEKNKEYSKEKITFKVTTDEDAKVYFSLDGDDKIKMSNPYDHVFTYTISISDDDHTVTFYATDTAGNTAKKSVEFSNDYKLEDATTHSTSSSAELEKISGTGIKSDYVAGKEPTVIYLDKTTTNVSIWQKICNSWKAFWEWLTNVFKNLFGIKN